MTCPELSTLIGTLAAMFAALGVAPAWTLCVEIGGAHAGVVSGAMNMFGNLGGALVSLVVGFSLKYLHSWNAPLYSISAFYLAAAGAWLLVDPDQIIVAESPLTARA